MSLATSQYTKKVRPNFNNKFEKPDQNLYQFEAFEKFFQTNNGTRNISNLCFCKLIDKFSPTNSIFRYVRAGV